MLVDLTSAPVMQLLVDRTRRSEVAGAELAAAHRAVGRALAGDVVRDLPLVMVPIQHPAGASTGVAVQSGREPIIVAMMRAGLFLAEGLWEVLPSASLVPHDDKARPLEVPASGRLVIVVDSVINSGRTIRQVLARLHEAEAGQVVVATLVGYRPTLEALATEWPTTTFVAARISERSYVGQGGTDTGARLFGTTTWATER